MLTQRLRRARFTLAAVLTGILLNLCVHATELTINGVAHPLSIGSGDISVFTQVNPILIRADPYVQETFQAPVGVNGTFGAGPGVANIPFFSFGCPILAVDQ